MSILHPHHSSTRCGINIGVSPFRSCSRGVLLVGGAISPSTAELIPIDNDNLRPNAESGHKRGNMLVFGLEQEWLHHCSIQVNCYNIAHHIHIPSESAKLHVSLQRWAAQQSCWRVAGRRRRWCWSFPTLMQIWSKCINLSSSFSYLISLSLSPN